MLRQPKEERSFGIKKGGLFFSNSVEVLLEHLKLNLFFDNTNLFAERFLLVPSRGMEQWIQKQFASSLSIACGFSTTFLHKGIDRAIEKFFSKKQAAPLPTRLELFLSLEKHVENALTSSDPLWSPLIDYIGKKERRKMAVVQQLTQLFERYGVYGGFGCADWEKAPQTWQEALWANVFQEWEYPIRFFKALTFKEKIDESASFHLFAFSHISSLHYHFFSKLSERIPVCIYHLSPCQEFWGDLSADSPSLLASLGRVGREMGRLFEESPSPTEEGYLLFGGNTDLKKLQRELLTLQPESGESPSTIEVHALATAHHEISHLHRFLAPFFAQGKIEPKDVIVMAPQIALYAPYIQAVFPKEGYTIADMPVHKHRPLATALFLLFELEENRWSAPSVLELFHHPLFKQKHRLSDEELQQIRRWVKKTGVYWGIDGEHRAELLKRGHCPSTPLEESATWARGFGHLVEELAYGSDPSLISFSQGEMLGNFLTLLHELYNTLKAFEIPKPLQEWVVFLKDLLTRYLLAADEEDSLQKALEKMEKSGRFFPDRLYSFSLMRAALEMLIQQESVTLNGSVCQAIHFCSMLPMRAIPAKVICLLGMNQDSYPRQEELKTWDLLKEHPQSDYYPSRIDFDRYIFLEVILSAREKIHISYIGQDPYDLTERSPSSCIDQLLASLPSLSVTKHFSEMDPPVHVHSCSPLRVKAPPPCLWPTGDVVVECKELGRLVRSPLRHYLEGKGIKIREEEAIEEEEPFFLSPIKKGMLRAWASKHGVEAALQQGENEGVFPPGRLGKIARRQFEEELSILPNTLKTIELSPFTLKVNPSLTLTFVGEVEGMTEEGFFLAEPCTLKAAIKQWPSFLLLHASGFPNPSLNFALTQEKKEPFFDDPRPYLTHLAEFYFLAQQHPLFLTLDWVEPILKKDARKLSQLPLYDSLLQWQFRGKGNIAHEAFIEAYSPLLEKLYQEMQHAWF